MDLRSASEYVRFILLGAFLVLAGKFLVTGLWRVYRFFALYVAVQCGLGLVVLFIRSSSRPGTANLLAWVFVCSEILNWILQFLTIIEIYESVLKRHPGIATLGRRCLTGALAISVGLSALTLLLDLPAHGPPRLENFLIISRFVSGSLLLFLILIIVFLVWFPISLGRNTVLHCAVFTAYFFFKTVILFLRNMQGVQFTPILNLVLAVLISMCVLTWIMFLNRAGETARVKVGHRSSPDEEKRLLLQLDAINETLLASSKK